MTVVRNYSTSAIIDLLERTDYYMLQGDRDMIEIEYLRDAVRHYHDGYSKLYSDWCALVDAGLKVRGLAGRIIGTLEDSPL